MNIYHLKYFIDAARLQSVSRSAQENLVSHSAVSQAIRSLEDYFEVPLIFHSKRRFQLTPEGEMCWIEGQKILESLSETKDHLQASRQEVRGTLSIWAPQSLIVDSLYKTLALYQKKYPKVQISLKPGVAAQVRSSVSSGEGNIGILVDDGDIDNFASVTLRSGHFVLIAKPKSTDLHETGLIVTSRNKIEVQHLFKNFKTKLKKEPRIEMEVMSWGVIKNLVDKNFGVGYVPDYCVVQELESGKLRSLAMPGSAFKYEVKAIWSQHKQLHPNAKLFVELLKQECQK